MSLPLSYHQIQILVHCDPSRAIRACMLACSVPQQIEVLCAVNGTLDEVTGRLGSTPIPTHLTFIPMARRSPYPANVLRNLALSHATAEWIFYIDCDFVFCDRFWTLLLSGYGSLMETSDRVCFCPVALWDPKGRYLNQPKSQNIINTETLETHRPPREWAEASMAELFKYNDRYFTEPFGPASHSYDITRQIRRLRNSTFPAEPWGIVRRRHCPLADEDFGAGPLDKQQFVSALVDRGFHFYALADQFIFHLWHPDMCEGWPDRVHNQSLWLKRYSGRDHHYLLIGVGGVLPPKLLTCLEASLKDIVTADYDASVGLTQGSTTSSGSTYGGSEMARCIDAVRYRARVVVGPSYLARELLGYRYRVLVFFQSPSFYRGRSRDVIGATDHDCQYLELFAHTANLEEALSRVDNVALLCDASNPAVCTKALQNIIGSRIPDSWCDGWEACALRAGGVEERTERGLYPKDYVFYDYLRVLAGSL
jgi:hypothetical protein